MGIKLVAFDGTESSRKAIDKAAGLMGPRDELLLLMVVPSGSIEEFADLPPDVTVASARLLVNAELDALKERGVRAMGIVREGDVAAEILNISSMMLVDIIVIGHHGVSKVGRFAVANVAEHVAKHADRPVLVVS